MNEWMDEDGFEKDLSGKELYEKSATLKLVSWYLTDKRKCCYVQAVTMAHSVQVTYRLIVMYGRQSGGRSRHCS